MKSKDYFTSNENYVDDDDLTRTFTFIDHSKKTTVFPLPSGEEISQAKKDLIIYRSKLIADIQNISASICPLPFNDFLIRGEGHEIMSWNETMLNDEGLPLQKLIDLSTILKNRFTEVNRVY